VCIWRDFKNLSLTNALEAAAKKHNAKWKIEDGQTTPFLWTNQTVTYIGITFESCNHQVSWQHAKGKVEQWGERVISLTPVTSWRDAAELLGIVIWDWTVSGESRASLRLAINLARKLGALQLKNAEWDAWQP